MQQNPTPGNNPQNPTNNFVDLEKAMKTLKDGISNVYKGLRDETISLEETFSELNAKMAGTLGQTQRSIQGLRQEAAVAYPTIVGLGGSFADVQKIQLGIAESLQTNTITLGETVSGLYAGAKAVGVSSEGIGSMVTAFENVGIQTNNIKDKLQSTVSIARSIGVNTSAVFKNVQDNLGSINKYGFQNGVDGLARMSAQAASLRINMSDIFGFAERVFNPEGATEMVSAFQRMGVAAGDLADPFRLMYLASEDTEELQKQVVKMTEKFTYFDEKSKEFKVFPNAKRDLREISTATGIGYEDLVKMSQAGQKMQMLTKDFKMAGIDEESKQFIANVATYSKEKGGFTVKVSGEQKLVSQLNTKDLEELKQAQAPRTVEELAKDQLTETQLMSATLKEIKAGLAVTAAGARAPQDLREVIRASISSAGAAAKAAGGDVRGGIRSADKFYEETGQSLVSIIQGEGGLKKLQEVVENGAGNVANGFKKMGETLDTFDYGKIAKPYISAGNKIAEGAEAAYAQIAKATSKAVGDITGSDLKRSEVSKSKTVNNTTNVEFNPLEVKGGIDITLKNSDGSSQKLTPDQIQQLINNSEFQKAIQKMFQDMQPRGPYANVPNKVPGS